MAVDPEDFVGDLTTDGTDTLVEISQDNNLADQDVIVSPDVQNNGQVTQNVTATGGFAGDDDVMDNGVTNGGGSGVVVGDDLELTGYAAAAANAEAAARAFTQDIETGGNVQGNFIDVHVVGSNVSIDDVGEDDQDNGAPNPGSIVQLGPDGPIGEALSGLAFPTDGAGTDTEFHISQNNFMDDRDSVTNAEVTNNDDLTATPGIDVEQTVTATGGDSFSGIGVDIDGAPLFADTSVGDDLTIIGETVAEANALAEAEAFTQEITTGGNAQYNSFEATVIGGNQAIHSTGDDDDESVDLVSDNEDDTETFFGSGPNGDGNISQTNTMLDGESGEFTIVDPQVQNDADPSAEAAQTVMATGGNAETDDGIDTDDGGSSILDGVDVGDNLSISGSAHAMADATATAEAFTQRITSGGNTQHNSFAATVVSGSQNDIDIGEDNSGSPGFTDATIAPQDTIEESEDTETNFDVVQNNFMDDQDTIANPLVYNGDIPDGIFDGGASLSQSATATGGFASADDGIDADGLGGDAISLTDVGDDADISGSSAADANATAAVTAFTQDLTTGGNTQINEFAAEVIGGSQTTINVGEDDIEDLAQVRSDDGVTETNVNVFQTNTMFDSDTVDSAVVFNDAGSDLEQTATATGGTADADDGITVIGSGDNFVDSPAPTIADDLSINGEAHAHADGIASAEAFTQDISTGGNGQLNSFGLDVVGGSQNVTDIVGDNAGDDANFANSPLGGAGGPTVTDVNLSQVNTLDDTDTVISPQVLNDHDPGPGPFPDGSGNVTQTVSATGGTAPGIGFSGDAAGIDATGLGGAIARVTVGDDASVSGSTEASTDAMATAEAFTQDVHTGGNTQVNAADMSVIGATQNAVLTGEDDLEGVDLAADADGETATTFGNFILDEEDDPIVQSNVLDDRDSVTDAHVENENGGTLTQNVTALGGGAPGSGTGGSTVASGIKLGDTAEVVDIVGTIGDDLEISGDASATSDAIAYAESFTQDIHTGGNVQLNDFTGSVVGGSENVYAAGDDDGGVEDDDVDPGFVAPAFGLVEGTNTQINVDQSNSLDDQDTVEFAEVINNGGPGVPEGVVDQDATATGGVSLAGDGIGGDTDGMGALVTNGTVGDDLTIAGSTEASSDGVAALEAFTQTIHTGGNAQYNVADVTIVGGNDSTLSAGEDDEGTGTLDIADVSILGGTDSDLLITQSNGGPGMDGAALDQDVITSPLVSNQSSGAGGDEGLEQDATGTGGMATAGSGIATSGSLVNADVGDDAAISGLADASADGAGLTEAFSQGLTTGENRQANEASAAIVGANKNANLTGGDDDAGGDDTVIGGVTGDADSLFVIDQSNTLNDSDQIFDPIVESANGDTVQNATSNGGTATAGNGVQANGAGSSGQTDDDFSINGETIASADALSDASVFTQDVDTGGNVQANSAWMSVVGYNDSLFFTGEDDGDDATDLPALSPLVPTGIDEPDGEFGTDGDGVDTAFDVIQTNALVDNDLVTNPQVYNLGPDSETTQTVNATGGTATAQDGVAGGPAGLFDSYTVLDDLSVNGVTEATANAYGAADAFTQNVVVGANVQVNTVDISVVGGSTAVNVVGEDDLTTPAG